MLQNFASRSMPFGALLVLSCSSTDTPAVVAPPGPPGLVVAQLLSAGCDDADGGNGGAVVVPTGSSATVKLGADPAGTVVVVVGNPATKLITNFTLAAPFQCIGVPQCGYLLATIDPGAGETAIAAASAAVPLPLGTLPTPEGAHTVRVALMNSDGNPSLDPKGAPYAITLTLNVQGRCAGPAASDGGTPRDAASDAPEGAPPPDATSPLTDATNISDARIRPDSASPSTDASAHDGALPVTDAGARDARAD